MATPTKVHLDTHEQPAFSWDLTPASARTTSELLQLNHDHHHIFFNKDGFHNHIAHHLLTTYALNALPSLNGSVGYIFSSCDLDLKSSGDVRFKDVVERFKIFEVPKRPEGKAEEWLAGKRVEPRGVYYAFSVYAEN